MVLVVLAAAALEKAVVLMALLRRPRPTLRTSSPFPRPLRMKGACCSKGTIAAANQWGRHAFLAQRWRTMVLLLLLLLRLTPPLLPVGGALEGSSGGGNSSRQ